MLSIVAALALAAFAGAALASVLAPKISLGIGGFFFFLGVWWENAASKFAVVRNFVFIFASSLMMTAGIAILGFGILSLAPLTHWASQYQPHRESLAASAVVFVLFLWGTGETIARGLKKVAAKRVPGRGWFDALITALFL